ncbi:glycosyltransferase [Puniceicoccaceae bacterium]|nr:glycosyltransferase [Puniceicoccaceae bacterium]
MSLKLSVIIPTRNSMPHIEQHVAALNDWIGQAREVVVVDSESADGTIEYIREHLEHPDVIYLDHPPGLYQSWNAGIQCVTSQYTYIATVNDFMPFETLLRLYEAAELHEADVVVSEPKIVSTNPGREPKLWPIHRFIESCAIDEPYVISPLELLVCNSIDLPGTLIGSSASNLYRTSALQKQPFPCDYGHAGDSAWALLSSLKQKWAIVPFGKSTFWYHGGGHASKSGRELRSKLHALAACQVEHLHRASLADEPDQSLLEGLTAFSVLWAQREASVAEYQKYRKGGIPWVLLPWAWRCRRRKNLSKQKLDRHVQQLLQSLVDSRLLPLVSGRSFESLE